MRLTLEPLRFSLLAALGLLACNPKPGEDTSDTAADTTVDPETTGGGGVTTGPAGETTASSAETGMSASGTSGPTTTGDETGPVTASSTGTSATAETGQPFECGGVVTEILQDFTQPAVPSGFEQCDGGIIHRADKLECGAPTTPTSCEDFTGGGTCESDADCTDKPFGSCQQDMIFGGILPVGGTCSCVYGCASDSDCDAGQVCRCAGPGLGLYTECVAAPDCTVDSDCPDGEVCGLSPDTCAPGGFLLACTTPNDLCGGDADCDAPPCQFMTDHWACSDAVCGRPFVVDEVMLTAPVAARDDWRGLVRAPEVDERTAARLAEHWTRIGQVEHASVASFAQFVLQLLAVGAGPELILAAQQALADEVEHARLAFALASLYAGTGVGPGPLAIAGAAPTVDLGALVEAAIREACVGETLAAFEAREAAAQAEDAGVQAALRRISGDEQRHAELGWRFVQWALTVDASLHARVRATFAAAIAEARAGVARDAAAAADATLRGHGVVDAGLRAEIWGHGLREVIEPCVAALLATRLAA